MAAPNPNQNQFQGSMVDPSSMQGQTYPQQQAPGLVGYGLSGQQAQFQNLTGMYAVGAVATAGIGFGMGSQFMMGMRPAIDAMTPTLMAGNAGSRALGRGLTAAGAVGNFLDPFGGQLSRGFGGIVQGAVTGFDSAAVHGFAPTFRQGMGYSHATSSLMTGVGRGAFLGARVAAGIAGTLALEAPIQAGIQMYTRGVHEQEGIQFGQNIGFHPSMGSASMAQLRSFGAFGLQQMKQQYGLEADQISGIANQLGAVGEFSDTKDFASVRQRLKVRLNTLQKLEKETGLAMQESSQIVKQMSQNLGVSFDQGASALGKTIGLGAVSTMDASSLQQAGMAGTQIGLSFSPFVDRARMYKDTTEKVAALQKMYDENDFRGTGVTRQDVDFVGGSAQAILGLEQGIMGALLQNPLLLSAVSTKRRDGSLSTAADVQGFLEGGDARLGELVKIQEYERALGQEAALHKFFTKKDGSIDADAYYNYQDEVYQRSVSGRNFLSSEAAVEEFVRSLPEIVAAFKELKDSSGDTVNLLRRMGISDTKADLYAGTTGMRTQINSTAQQMRDNMNQQARIAEVEAMGGVMADFASFGRVLDEFAGQFTEKGTFTDTMRDYGTDLMQSARDMVGTDHTAVSSQQSINRAVERLKRGVDPRAMTLPKNTIDTGGMGYFFVDDEKEREFMATQLDGVTLESGDSVLQSENVLGALFRHYVLGDDVSAAGRTYVDAGGGKGFAESFGQLYYYDQDDIDKYRSEVEQRQGNIEKVLSNEDNLNYFLSRITELKMEGGGALRGSNFNRRDFLYGEPFASKLPTAKPTREVAGLSDKDLAAIVAQLVGGDEGKGIRSEFGLGTNNLITPNILTQAQNQEGFQGSLQRDFGLRAATAETLTTLDSATTNRIAKILRTSQTNVDRVRDLKEVGLDDEIIFELLRSRQENVNLGNEFFEYSERQTYLNEIQPSINQLEADLTTIGDMFKGSRDIQPNLKDLTRVDKHFGKSSRTQSMATMLNQIDPLQDLGFLAAQAKKSDMAILEDIFNKVNMFDKMDDEQLNAYFESQGIDPTTIKGLTHGGQGTTRSRGIEFLRDRGDLDLLSRRLKNSTPETLLKAQETAAGKFLTAAETFERAVGEAIKSDGKDSYFSFRYNLGG